MKEVYRMKKNSILKKSIAIITVVGFLFNAGGPCSLAWAKKTDTMPSPIGKDKSVYPGQLSFMGPNDINIPPVFGMVKERHQADTDPKGLIVHIQDLHTHYEAHKNISRIVEYLYEKHGIRVVLSEAKETDKGFAYLRPWTKKQARAEVAEKYLKDGIITGWEALDLTKDMDLVLQGIEDKSLYIKDMESFLKAEVIRPEALQFVNLLKSISNNLKLHMYSRPQRGFDEKITHYREENIGIADYTTYLTKQAGKHKIDYKALTNLGILLKTLELEKNINFKKAEKEREIIIEAMAKRLLEDEMKGLLDMSMKFKTSKISQNEFYQYLLGLADRLDISMKRYQNFSLYTQYIAVYHDLDASRLFEEINTLENLLADAVFTKEGQKELFKISKNLIILKGLVDFKLTPDEFDYYNKTKAGFDTGKWLSFLRLNSEYFKLSQVVPSQAAIIEDNIPILENFYNVARQRDEAFVANIEKQFNKRNINTAFLMTGGFHTPGVTRLLKDAGYSYVVISPRIEEEMDYENYYKRLKDAYSRLKETTAIGAWSGTEIQGILTQFVGDLKTEYGDGVNLVEDNDPRVTSRGAKVALVTGETAYFTRLAYSRLTPERLNRFMTSAYTLRMGRATQEARTSAVREIYETANMLRTSTAARTSAATGFGEQASDRVDRLYAERLKAIKDYEHRKITRNLLIELMKEGIGHANLSYEAPSARDGKEYTQAFIKISNPFDEDGGVTFIVEKETELETNESQYYTYKEGAENKDMPFTDLSNMLNIGGTARLLRDPSFGTDLDRLSFWSRVVEAEDSTLLGFATSDIMPELIIPWNLIVKAGSSDESKRDWEIAVAKDKVRFTGEFNEEAGEKPKKNNTILARLEDNENRVNALQFTLTKTKPTNTEGAYKLTVKDVGGFFRNRQFFVKFGLLSFKVARGY